MAPMPDAELLALSAAARAGDADARNRIVGAYRHFARRVAGEAWRRHHARHRGRPPIDDARQEAMVALIAAASSWRPGGVPFPTFVAICAKRAVRKAARRHLAAPAPLDPADDPIAGIPAAVSGPDAELSDHVHDALSRLDPASREMLVRRYGIGGAHPPQPVRDIALSFGLRRRGMAYRLRAAETRLGRIL